MPTLLFTRPQALAAAAALALTAAAEPAHAVDGCLVLLCFAAPSWRAIPQCVPPIKQVLRDLARGRPFPTCDMGGPGNHGALHWARAPGFCPPQYTSHQPRNVFMPYACAYSGAIDITLNGQFWSRTWWSMHRDMDSVTEWSDAAKASISAELLDTRFDDDYARWAAKQAEEAEAARRNGGLFR